jgi:hypothetical protein
VSWIDIPYGVQSLIGWTRPHGIWTRGEPQHGHLENLVGDQQAGTQLGTKKPIIASDAFLCSGMPFACSLSASFERRTKAHAFQDYHNTRISGEHDPTFEIRNPARDVQWKTPWVHISCVELIGVQQSGCTRWVPGLWNTTSNFRFALFSASRPCLLRPSLCHRLGEHAQWTIIARDTAQRRQPGS